MAWKVVVVNETNKGQPYLWNRYKTKRDAERAANTLNKKTNAKAWIEKEA